MTEYDPMCFYGENHNLAKWKFETLVTKICKGRMAKEKMKQDKIELYGWEVSPCTAKVEIYLKYKGIPFRTVRPNAYTLFRKIQPAVGKAIMLICIEIQHPKIW
jgi:hypothetical protein